MPSRILSLLVGTVSDAVLSPTPPAPSGVKNVLFVLFDDYRAMHKTYGWSQPHLPNADRLAADSLVFDHVYVQQAVCGPSRASLLSGRRPDRTQMWNFIDGDAPGGWRNAPGALDWNSWPQYFGTKGYYVAGAGKMYHRGDPTNGDPPSWTEPECKSHFPFYGQGNCPNSLQGGKGCAVDTSKHPECFNGKLMCFPDNATLAKGVEFLRKAAKQQPFWLGVGFVKPHLPHIYPKEFENLVPKLEDIDLPPNPNFPKDAPPISWLSEGPMKNIDIPATDDAARELRHAYYSVAAYSDSLLGTLLDEVDALGLRDNTLVVLTADHGWGLGEHNHWLKYTNFETDTRVPLFVRAPWMGVGGKRSSAIVELVDLYPTSAELAGVPIDVSQESVDGTSFAHVFKKPSKAHKDAAFSQYPRCWNSKFPQNETAFPHMSRCAEVDKHDFAYMGYSIRTDRWRYTEWAKWDGKNLRPIWEESAGVELYDHKGDDGPSSKASYEQFENVNVASQKLSVVASLSTQLRSHFDNDTVASAAQGLLV